MTRTLGIELPIAQAPMGRTVPPEMAAAVAEAGGLGMMGVSWDSLAKIERHIAKLKSLTVKPVAFNLGLEFDQAERLAFLLESDVKIISLFGGDPAPFADSIKAVGARMIVTVGSVAEAERAVACGADLLCAQNAEAGGHVYSDVGGLSLTPQIVDAADGVPVIVAGGISDGRGLVAALALGAAGVWLGTRFLLTEESHAHPDYKRMLLQADADDTVKLDLFNRTWPDAPHRVLKNSTYNSWRAAGELSGADRPGADEVVAHRGDAPLYRYSEAAPLEDDTGDIEAMALYSGQSVGAIDRLQSVGAVISMIMRQAEITLSGLARDHRTGVPR